MGMYACRWSLLFIVTADESSNWYLFTRTFKIRSINMSMQVKETINILKN